MDLLNNDMRKMLAKKLLFTLNFMMATSEDFFEKFNLIINDISENRVVRFDLNVKESMNVYISFKRLSNDEFTVEYHVINEDTGLMNAFPIYVDRESEFSEYYNSIVELFELVTEKARQEQFEMMEKSINDLLF